MKMQEVNIELLAFDSTDVIATSGAPVDDSTVSVIWLTPKSVEHYNAVYINDIDLEYKSTYSSLAWIGYSGEYDEIDGVWRWAARKTSKDTAPDKGIRTVDADGSGYDNVLRWLEANKKTVEF